MENGDLIPHLFRTEYRKIVSVLCSRFGFAQIETAEDIASDTFLTATQSWGLEGVPAHPVAWLYQVAKNKALNHLQRSNTFKQKIVPELKTEPSVGGGDDIDLSPKNIADSQLQMMFAICNPLIPAEAQIGLALRILCGFGIDEIAEAFLSNKETINKRLFRAKEKLREARIQIAVPNSREIGGRLAMVLHTVYLLFSEGYYSTNHNIKLRKDLCFEAMRLCTLLVENEGTDLPETNALMALMCFHASRFEARQNRQGDLILYDEQDEAKWNRDLMAKGAYFLSRSAHGSHASRYHLEAGIAYWSTQKEESGEKWENILQLYNQLLLVEYSPAAALNRSYALAKARGYAVAITEAEKLQLNGNPFYELLLGELYTQNDAQKAKRHLEKALALAKTEPEREVIRHKISRL